MLACLGSAARAPDVRLATGTIATAALPYFPGSVFPVRVDGFRPPYRVAVVGPGAMLAGGSYAIPSSAAPGESMLLAASPYGLAQTTIAIAPVPPANATLLAVAAYDDGVVIHDAATFERRGLLAVGGAPADVVSDGTGGIATADTQGDTATFAARAPWNVRRVGGVPLADEIEFDRTLGALFVTNRDVGGSGALTRIDASGSVARVKTGATAEGLAIDERRGLAYVANVNDDTVAVVDAASMKVVRRFHAVPRVFSLALSPDGDVLYATSNQSKGSPFEAPGSVAAFDVRAGRAPHARARSAALEFPLGVALDASDRTLFVTDEALDEVYVLDPASLRPKHAPLSTCSTPWKPSFDAPSERLYVPCARAGEVDVFDARRLVRIAGAPFKTGGYPLAVTVWHGARHANR